MCDTVTELKFPIEARAVRFNATSLLKEGEQADGAHEYLVHSTREEVPVVICHGTLQLQAVYEALSLPMTQVNDHVANMCTKLVGRVMSDRIHNEDFYDSGRENQGYELAWLPGQDTYDKIIRTLEHVGEHGLAALMREGRVRRDS